MWNLLSTMKHIRCSLSKAFISEQLEVNVTVSLTVFQDGFSLCAIYLLPAN